MLSQTSYVGVSVKVRNIWRVAELYNSSSFESLLAIRATEFDYARWYSVFSKLRVTYFYFVQCTFYIYIRIKLITSSVVSGLSLHVTFTVMSTISNVAEELV